MKYISSVIENDEDPVGIFDKSGESMKKFSHEILLMVGYLFNESFFLSDRSSRQNEEEDEKKILLVLIEFFVSCFFTVITNISS